MQCRSSCAMNLDTFKKKRTADEAFEKYKYVYGIIITEREEGFRGYSGLVKEPANFNQERVFQLDLGTALTVPSLFYERVQLELLRMALGMALIIPSIL
ncbi:hypothetical protein RhiirA4_549135 [Rhizophagus irregularis]|uniref:Uncharacterized protein n=1 Tax=Rhizophagus irregularis TaxID=588596 RepID=A0A2I1HBG4_9GLOM|nr:hypothetical protein RhiirA4_549135 [Rhizophagus irregularis]